MPSSWSILPRIVLGSIYAQEEGQTVCSRHEFYAKRKKEWKELSLIYVLTVKIPLGKKFKAGPTSVALLCSKIFTEISFT